MSAGRAKWGEPGSRVSRKTSALVMDGGARRVVVTVYPNGIIGLRPERRRKEEFVDAAWAWRQAVFSRVMAERAAKRKSRKGGK